MTSGTESSDEPNDEWSVADLIDHSRNLSEKIESLQRRVGRAETDLYKAQSALILLMRANSRRKSRLSPEEEVIAMLRLSGAGSIFKGSAYLRKRNQGGRRTSESTPNRATAALTIRRELIQSGVKRVTYVQALTEWRKRQGYSDHQALSQSKSDTAAIREMSIQNSRNMK